MATAVSGGGGGGGGQTLPLTLFGDDRERRGGRMSAAPSKPIQREQWTLNTSLITKMRIF